MLSASRPLATHATRTDAVEQRRALNSVLAILATRHSVPFQSPVMRFNRPIQILCYRIASPSIVGLWGNRFPPVIAASMWANILTGEVAGDQAGSRTN